ncbi:MAG: sugar transferase (PEP-CTERM system associated) [Oleiphilaceae bacterium]|jgi:sugar transferase (PEP-CTERM system associated)
MQVAHVRVLNHYLHTKFLFLGALEFVLLMCAVLIGIDVRNLWSDEFSQLYLELPEIQLFVFAFVMSCCSLAMGVYTSIFREGLTGMLLRTIVAYFFLGTASLTILYYIFPSIYLGRGVLAFAILFALVFVLVIRALFYKVVDLAQLSRNVVILGAGKTARQLLDKVRPEDANLSFKIFGCVVCGEGEILVDEKIIINDPIDWAEFVKKENISEIVVAPDERRRSEGGDIPTNALLDCKLRGIRVTEPMAFIERELLKIEVEMLRPSWALFADGFVYSQFRDLMKRAFDLSVALFIFIFAWPFMLLTAIAVRLESVGPVFYKQVRIGLNGKEFPIYKFRSMTQDAEKDGKAVWATKNDARVTRVGSFIRNTRLDELPQLYNVFKGNMSFVGPRPERPQFVDELKEVIPFYDARHRVKPGLMGWAQLKYPYGASVEDAQNKLKYDLYYVKNHSFFMDVLIVIQTVEVVLLGKGVH